MASPAVLPDEPAQRRFVELANRPLTSAGAQLSQHGEEDGYPRFQLVEHGCGTARRPRNSSSPPWPSLTSALPAPSTTTSRCRARRRGARTSRGGTPLRMPSDSASPRDRQRRTSGRGEFPGRPSACQMVSCRCLKLRLVPQRRDIGIQARPQIRIRNFSIASYAIPPLQVPDRVDRNSQSMVEAVNESEEGRFASQLSFHP
ncbi:hypothetical protein [Streptomyces sp. NPDC001502]|uniref:AbiJ-related protein n=1 Tax=Streptomyces sp. NPDC001502 TaxID=3364578 RepID=UPI00367B1C3C